MKYLALLTLSLAGLSSAIDAVLHVSSSINCSGPIVACTNLNPNVCCALSGRGNSAFFRALPRNWNIQGRAYIRPNCDPYEAMYQVIRGSDPAWKQCMSGYMRPPFVSLGYGFVNLRRGVEVVEGGVEGGMLEERGDGEECVKPDTMEFPDGSRFNLTAMGSEMGERIMNFTEASGRADLPDEFNEFIY